MKRKRGFEASVSLFPFLDVLICTMGALILALVVAVLDAAASARREALAADGAGVDEQQADLELRIEQLDAQRQANLSDLETERRALAHIEDHVRMLREQLASAQSEAENLALAATNALADRSLLQKRLAEIAQEIKRLEALLAAQRRDLAAAPPAYSVVPYVGPNGTRRRPIYIECRADRVIVQPEGVELGAEDFDGPLGPGNPLAAAVRTASQRAGGVEDAGAAPYPFLLVRPDGVEAYAAARAALKSWGSDFGYELIDQDWELALPPSDRALAQRIEAEVSDARERQRILAESVPRLRGEGGSRPMFRADPVRGIVQVGSGSRRRGGISNAGGFTTANAPGGFGAEGRGAGARGHSSGELAGDASGGAELDGTSESGHGGSGAAHGNGAAHGGAAYDGTSGPAGPLLADATGGAHAGGADPGGRGTLSGKAPSDVAAELARERAAESGPGGGATGGDARFASGTLRGAQGGAAPPPAVAGGMPGGADQGSPAAGSGPKLGEYVERPPRGAEESLGAGDRHAKSVKSLSEKRGRDWALPAQARSATPITRPIRIELRDDALRVLADDGATARKSIALEESTLDAVDDLVGAVWDAIRDWGIAGRGQYWRPVLVIDVAPGAERRYAELQGLLAESGLEVRPRLAERSTPTSR